MKIILSPAKKMKVDTDSIDTMSSPVFLEKAEEILGWMQGRTEEELKKLWKCNDKITTENIERIKTMNFQKQLTPAVLAYEGIAYQYMAPAVFEDGHFDYVQEHLRILSAFYGVLKPMDGITPYRLEMQAKAAIGDFTNLYDFWGDNLYWEVISVVNQKGGVGKTTTTVNVGIGLAREGKKVLLIDADPQGSLTASLGYEEPDDLRITLATIMMDVINEEEINLEDGILHHQENVDLLPANIELSALEVTMGNVMSREMIMKEYIDAIRSRYDYILIDCMPSLGMMTINALVSSDSVLIPVQAAYLPVKGLQQLIKTILTVKKRLNRKLAIEGILLTMVDFRTNYARDIASRVHTTYGSQIEVFENVIPMSVKAAETSAEGKSIYMHCPKGKVAEAYKNLTQEVLKNEK